MTTSVRINFRADVIAAFTNYDRKRKLCHSEKTNDFGPFAEQLMIASAWCLSKCYFVLTCCLSPDSAKRNGRTIDELIWRYLDWKQSEWTLWLPHVYIATSWFAWGKRNCSVWEMISFSHTRYDLHTEISISCHSHYEIILIADTPWSKKPCQGILINNVWFVFYMRLNLVFYKTRINFS